MKNDIKKKLALELSEDISKESQVIYILSCIRKILEIDQNQSNYIKLKSFCDWALHSRLDNTDPFREELADFPHGELSSYFYTHEVFKKEFKRFVKDYSIETNIYSDKEHENKFKSLLYEIYIDTPLIVKTIKKKKITFKEGSVKGNMDTIEITVQDIE